jgi:hypothetical protein
MPEFPIADTADVELSANRQPTFQPLPGPGNVNQTLAEC